MQQDVVFEKAPTTVFSFVSGVSSSPGRPTISLSTTAAVDNESVTGRLTSTILFRLLMAKKSGH